MALLDVDEWALVNWWLLLRCEQCGTQGLDIAVRPSLTAYDDPALNRCPLLCDLCAGMYADYWNNQWAEYHASRG